MDRLLVWLSRQVLSQRILQAKQNIRENVIFVEFYQEHRFSAIVLPLAIDKEYHMRNCHMLLVIFYEDDMFPFQWSINTLLPAEAQMKFSFFLNYCFFNNKKC
jgi:hypothetical protein